MSTQTAETLISCENVSKRFCRSLKKSLAYGLLDVGTDLFRIGGTEREVSLRDAEFWAVNDVSFEVKRGECLGLIGHNGAGKTTVLKMLNGLIKPDEGAITMRGRVSALIALGAGFDPVLTGRENIYVNAGILGVSRSEVKAKMEEIIDFAEIEDAIDSPVRTYSSGMQVRLGFAIAVIAADPDILLLDEVLAVGDSGFLHKSFAALRKKSTNCATIVVSHSMPILSQIATSCLLMDGGKVISGVTSMSDAFEKYYSLTGTESHSTVRAGEGITISSVSVNGGAIGISEAFHTSTRSVRVVVRFESDIESEIVCSWLLKSRGLVTIAASEFISGRLSKGENTLEFQFDLPQLNSGRYPLQLGMAKKKPGSTENIVGDPLGVWEALFVLDVPRHSSLQIDGASYITLDCNLVN